MGKAIAVSVIAIILGSAATVLTAQRPQESFNECVLNPMRGVPGDPKFYQMATAVCDARHPNH